MASPGSARRGLAIAFDISQAYRGLDEAGRQLLSVVLYAVVSLAIETA